MHSHGTASCRNFHWILDFCAARHLDSKGILRHVPYSESELTDPSAFIEWQYFLTLFANLQTYLTDDELFEAGVQSWEHKSLNIYAAIGKLIFGVEDQYQSVFGRDGVMARLYPIEMDLAQPSSDRLKVSLKMTESLAPCRAFQIVVAGQLAGMPKSIGEPLADVTVHHNETGAIFDIWYQSEAGIFTKVKRALGWPLAARESGRQLMLTYDSLLEQHHELRNASTKLKAAENQALESETRYQLLENNVNDIIWILDPDMNLQYMSASIHAFTGFSRQELLAMNQGEIFIEESRKKMAELVQAETFAGGPRDPLTIEVGINTKQGEVRWVEIQANFVFDADENPLHLLGVARDISERKAFEIRLKESEESYRAITTSAQDAIITVDHNNRITFANPATERIFGYSLNEFEGMSLRALMPNAHNSVLLFKQSKDQEPKSLAIEGIRRNGMRVPLEASFAEHDLHGSQYITWIIRDITFRARIEEERKALEQQLQAAQRMDSIGQLTGGIAHDFNNLLVAINGYAELGLAKEVDQETLKQYLKEILHAGGRAADMTNKLLAFSRRQIIEPKPLQVNQLISGIEKIIDRLLPENISIRFVPDLTDPSIIADPGQIEQVVVNLAVNARDAMPDGGRLMISIDQRSLRDSDLLHAYQRPGDFVVINVEDNGVGMTEEVRKRLFEPFFTTKPEGAGTGLGMAVVFGIIKQHDGFIEVVSMPGEGSKFEVYLPLAGVQEIKAVVAERLRPASGGFETILLVEDNLYVRDLAKLILKDAGYEIVEANDGVEAIELFEQMAGSIDLVIMDVVMPRLGGKDVMQHMHKINPNTRILFTSGYSRGGIHTNFILEEGLEFIRKPYGADKLRGKVRSILDARAQR